MERTIAIAEEQNRLTVSTQKARSIEITDASGGMAGRAQSDQDLAPQVFYLPAGKYQVVADGDITDVTIDTEVRPTTFEFAQLVASSDATDFHVVDGIPEIPADGSSFTTITIRKCNTGGELLAGEQDNDEIYLRTDAGTIKDAHGEQDIRKLNLARGQAAFRLYAEDRKRVATVQVLAASPLLANTAISIEFY